MRLFSAPEIFIPDEYGMKNRRRKSAPKMAPVSGTCVTGIIIQLEVVFQCLHFDEKKTPINKTTVPNKTAVKIRHKFTQANAIVFSRSYCYTL